MCTVLLAVGALLTACTSDDPERPAAAEGCGALEGQAETPLAVPTVPEVPEARANVVVKLSSSSRQAREVTLRAGEQVLLAVRVPPAPQACYLGGRVFVHGFRLSPGAVQLEATAGEDRATARLVPGPERQWVTVLPQDGFPLDVKVWDEEPLFG